MILLTHYRLYSAKGFIVVVYWLLCNSDIFNVIRTPLHALIGKILCKSGDPCWIQDLGLAASSLGMSWSTPSLQAFCFSVACVYQSISRCPFPFLTFFRNWVGDCHERRAQQSIKQRFKQSNISCGPYKTKEDCSRRYIGTHHRILSEIECRHAQCFIPV